MGPTDALLDEVEGAMGTLALLLSHGRELGAPVTLAIRAALAEVSVKLVAPPGSPTSAAEPRVDSRFDGGR
ncbi:MAG TPA: hypothetical protein VK540_04020 [Polyangiaceae bacterium]|jgi:hypothetical protein|nr:hypothetical protein [Polyangiaceae bacterium]